MAVSELKTTSVISNELLKNLMNAVEMFSARRKELDALMNGAKTVLRQEGFLKSTKAIFDYCKDLIGATSGYVALLSDSGDGNRRCRTRSGAVYQTGSWEYGVQIILRTGYPGKAPERHVVLHYGISDYWEKTDLTADKLHTLVISGLRAHQTIHHPSSLLKTAES